MTTNNEDSGWLKNLLSISQVYDFFQHSVLGGRQAREWLAGNFWRLKGGERIVDIGCGSGAVLDFLPRDSDYIGIDVSESYIVAARKKYSGNATFFLGTPRDFLNQDSSPRNNTDLVLCNGLLHHLPDDQAREVLEIAKQLLKPGGRLVCLEATYLARQTRLSKWIVSTDRGRFVRSEQEWKTLFSQAFDRCDTTILTGLIRIPYTHIVIECRNEAR
ncbi:MAG TPA: methyltransferase [Pyrinomonadaceae bacterium]|nr:methyltransferase [Pyrinomonadaceae bacterium]